MTDEKPAGPIARIVRATTSINSNELPAAIVSFLFVFTLMAAYFILRPVRDSLVTPWSDAEVSFLWSLTFLFSVIAVSLYGAFISTVRFKWVVPGVYIFFAASFFLFYFGSSQIENPTLVNKSFYVWLSVFSLFHLSVFWSFMSDIFNKEQAPRIFAFIASGASVGALVGPTIPLLFTEDVGNLNLMLLSASMLVIPVPIIFWLESQKGTKLGNADHGVDLSREREIGRNPFSGFSLFIQSRYLIGIGVFIILYVAIGSFVYFGLKNVLVDYSRAERTELYALIDLAVNSMTILVAWFVTGRVASKLGMPTTLASIPVLVALGMLVLAMFPLVAVIAGLQIARRVGNYAVTRPGREMLFTVVNREVRFKAKPVIDIVLYRGGDMLWAWVFTGLTTLLGLSLAAVAGVGAFIALVWAAVGFWLGRQFVSFSADKTD